MSTEVERSPDIGFARPRAAKVDDEPFRASLADLARQLAQRAPHEPPPDPDAEVAELPPDPIAPARHYRLHSPYLGVLALVVGVAIAAIIHGLLGAGSEPVQPPAQSTVAVAPPLPDPVPPPSISDIAPTATGKIDPPLPKPAPPVVIPPLEPAPSRPSSKATRSWRYRPGSRRLASIPVRSMASPARRSPPPSSNTRRPRADRRTASPTATS